MERAGASTLTLTSAAFPDGGSVPKRYTCEGEDIFPPLAWTGMPTGTRSLVLIVDDPDAPDPKAPKRTWVHWVLYDIPASTTALPEGGALPADTRQGRNDWGRTGYGGPCPPIGRHRYFHKLYALDIVLGDLGEPGKGELEKAMKGHVLAESRIVGTYEKGRR